GAGDVAEAAAAVPVAKRARQQVPARVEADAEGVALRPQGLRQAVGEMVGLHGKGPRKASEPGYPCRGAARLARRGIPTRSAAAAQGETRRRTSLERAVPLQNGKLSLTIFTFGGGSKPRSRLSCAVTVRTARRVWAPFGASRTQYLLAPRRKPVLPFL